MCQYCPDPTYTEEARKTKLQGAVTLRVLVGEDGRAHEIQITKGLGLGLDEHAEEAVRTWQFVPAMDASHQAIASWVMIETTFRLF
jgi:TonB family protein